MGQKEQDQQDGPSMEAALQRIDSHTQMLAERRQQLDDLITPTTIGGKVVRLAGRFVPQLRDSLRQHTMAEISAGLRQSVYNVYGDMKVLLREGKKRADSHQELEDLVAEVDENPEDEALLEQLRLKLRARAEASLHLKKDPDTERLLAVLNASATPEQKARRRTRIYTEAQQLLALSKPTIEATQAVLINAAETFDATVATYGAVMELRPNLDAITSTAEDLTRAARLRITSFNTIVGQLDLAVEAARMATEAARLGRELDETINPEKLAKLSEKAQAINIPQNLALTVTESK